MFRLLALIALSFSSLLTSGCLAAQSFTSARTLEQGKTEVTVIAAAGFPNVETGYGGYAHLPAPSLGAQVRHGATEHLELGVTLGQQGLGGQLKFALLRSESPQAGASLSVAPAAILNPMALGQAGARLLFSGELPLLLGIHLGGGHELTLAPLARWTYGAGGSFVSAGGTLGVALRLSDIFVLTPEVGVMVPVMGEHPFDYRHSESVLGPVVPSFGLGMTWGR